MVVFVGVVSSTGSPREFTGKLIRYLIVCVISSWTIGDDDFVRRSLAEREDTADDDGWREGYSLKRA